MEYFPPVSKGDNFCDFLFASGLKSLSEKAFLLSEKESSLKEKNLLPKGVDSFSEGRQNKFERVAPHECASILPEMNCAI